MPSLFESIKFPGIKRNSFDLTHDVKTSFQMGKLVPYCCEEVIPGDIFNISVENMLRFAPLISPVYHRIEVTTHYYFVPTRLLWDQFQDWMFGNTDIIAPFINVDGVAAKSIGDYLGLPIGTYDPLIRVSAYPIAAYAMIWDEYYRDQDLQPTKLFQPLIPGSNNATYLDMLCTQTPFRRAWKKDYLTSARPWAQKGDAVMLPITAQDNIPVEFQNAMPTVLPVMRDPLTGALLSTGNVETVAGGVTIDGTDDAAYDPNGTLVVDVQAGATTIETLRTAWTIQGWLETAARAGTRFTEGLKAFFNVDSPDARLQRPEYLGGSKQLMVISEVLSTAQSANDPETATVPVGQMAGHGISAGGSGRFSYKATEHGYIIGIINVQPIPAYMEGIARMWTRPGRYDFAWPSFAHLGEQAVLQKEVRAINDTTSPDAVFGYQSRYAEYKHAQSRVSGDMRTTLDHWHLARQYADDPALNAEFIECRPGGRIFAVQTEEEDHIWAYLLIKIKALRPLPRFGIPSTI